MSKEQIKKNMRLSLDFDKYVSRNPKILKSVPKGASIVLTSSGDKKLSETNTQIARSAKSGRFVVAHKSNKGWHIHPVTP